MKQKVRKQQTEHDRTMIVKQTNLIEKGNVNLVGCSSVNTETSPQHKLDCNGQVEKLRLGFVLGSSHKSLYQNNVPL